MLLNGNCNWIIISPYSVNYMHVLHICYNFGFIK